ncbi:hypothetical protein [Cupriavidus nantongensis]|uniref:Acyl-CoA dehydrogenase n=1 Tax=Cupriavidus nantongensis TaxID=1796606 RepID=A0A142JMJ1_9BURK|nr:hypothetical protein [Cupriavidus nantongensis]AMR79303.1 hypothetical protein A2G96_17040 [Cupriavidus nantongensis]
MDDALRERARAFEDRIRVLRRKAGQALPEDFEFGTPEFAAAEAGMLRDIIIGLGGDPDAAELDLRSL